MFDYVGALRLAGSLGSTGTVMNPKADYDRAVNLYNAGNYSESLKAYEGALKSDPKNPYALYGKACALYVLGKYADALKCLQEVTIPKDKAAQSSFNLNERIADLRRRIATKLPQEPNPQRQAPPERSADVVRGDVVRVDERQIKEWKQKGYDAYQRGDLKNAEAYYLRIFVIDGNAADALNNLGAIHFGRKNYRTALKFFERAFELEPGNPDYRFNVELAQKALGITVEPENEEEETEVYGDEEEYEPEGYEAVKNMAKEKGLDYFQGRVSEEEYNRKFPPGDHLILTNRGPDGKPGKYQIRNQRGEVLDELE